MIFYHYPENKFMYVRAISFLSAYTKTSDINPAWLGASETR